jgi:CelD/BcsL family acetyltransferase involved in cellulose biosynthesis
VRVSVVRPGDLGLAEADRWAKFQRRSPVTLNPFMSHTFAQAVGRARPNARVAVVEDGGQIEAFLPYEVGPGRIGIPIGYPMNDLQGFISSAAPLDARQVIRRAGLRGWRFTAVPTDQTALQPYHYSGAAAASLVIDLAAGYAAYHASRSKSLTAEHARKRRAVARERGPVALVWNSGSSEHVGQMIAWKAARYAGTRKLFADPTARSIAESLAMTGKPDCAGAVSVLLAGDRPFAISCNLIGPAGAYGWFTSYDPELSRFSPGTMLTFAIAAEAAARGISTLDLGPGQDSYKLRLANAAHPVAGGAVWATGIEAALRQLYRMLRRRSVRAPHTIAVDQAS